MLLRTPCGTTMILCIRYSIAAVTPCAYQTTTIPVQQSAVSIVYGSMVLVDFEVLSSSVEAYRYTPLATRLPWSESANILQYNSRGRIVCRKGTRVEINTHALLLCFGSWLWYYTASTCSALAYVYTCGSLLEEIRRTAVVGQ